MKEKDIIKILKNHQEKNKLTKNENEAINEAIQIIDEYETLKKGLDLILS